MTGAPLLVPHMGVLSGRHPRNSTAAISECFDAGVERIEIDVHSLADADFVVYHDRRLENETTGSGSIGQATSADIRACEFRAHPGERPPLLSEIVALARTAPTQLQLDLKDWRPMTRERLRALADTVAPVKDRVIVSTGQDWNLLRLHAEDPELAYGFDPGHYIDHAMEGSPVFLPRTVGAYGYRDDHPLAYGRTEEPASYLRQRFEMLAQQAPAAREYFLSYRLVVQMLDDGFDVVAHLGERGVQTNVWTLDCLGPETREAYGRVAAAGVSRITTNTRPAWEKLLAEGGH